MSYIEVDVSGKALFNHERYRISVLRCCEEWCSPVKKIERRTREYYSLHFIIGGKGTLVYEMNGQRREVVLQKGDSFLLFAGEVRISSQFMAMRLLNTLYTVSPARFGWSVGGDCVGWDEETGQYVLSLGDKDPNLLALEDVTVNGRAYEQGEVLVYEDRNDMEIDFILSNNSKMKPKLYPIEVKSGKRYTTDSLDLFLRKYHQRIDRAYIVHTKTLAVNVEIVCIPAYMAILL